MSLFKRLFNIKNKSEKNIEDSEHSKYFPEQKLPIDERFTYNFNKNGGKFLYCANWEEVEEFFDNILLENDWYEKEVMCLDEQLTQKFSGYNLSFNNLTNSTFFFTKCESLVANNGGVLLSSNQLKEKKVHELPYHMVVFATTSQLVENISDGLRIIKNQSQKAIPTNITTIQDFEGGKQKDFMSYGSSTKNLYLLLLENL